jgi:hypothetical protein
VAGHRIADYLDVPVCAEHEAEIESGAYWDLRGDVVVMSADMAPALQRWSLFTNMGTEGFTLVLNTAGGGEPTEIFLTKAAARSLAIFLYPASGLALPAELVEAISDDEEEDMDW